METFLPSEIARLVLGYLEDHKCNEAARMFLETSPHLQECRTVASKGKRFSTRVSGLTLMDIVEKYSAISAMIQERLNKVADSDHLKHCGDPLEQLKFLVDETRGQRFVVNINVPSQTNQQILNGSPIISGSKRRRHHSNNDREKCKHIKLQDNVSQESDLPSNNCCNTVEATALESLPGNTDTVRHTEKCDNVDIKRYSNQSSEQQSQRNLSKSSSTDGNYAMDSRDKILSMDAGDSMNTQNCNLIATDRYKQDINAIDININKKCTTGTDTDELTSFSTAEVQTVPCDLAESESESNDEPIQNLSLLTKELLNRTELQERIAENINKAILPTDISFREDVLNESVGGELNTSIVSELNNAIKSIVEATEADPIFEKFLDEIIGKNVDTDTSPDEDTDAKSSTVTTTGMQEKCSEIESVHISSLDQTVAEVKSSNEVCSMEVPLKHRLRSSSRQQNTRTEDEVEKSKDQEKEHTALEDHNNAAIQSIINAIVTNTKPISDKNNIIDNKELPNMANETGRSSPVLALNNDNKIEQQGKHFTQLENQKVETNVETAVANNETETKAKKSTVKRARPSKAKREPEVNSDYLISEEEMMAMPTLIVCSKEEFTNFIPLTPSYPTTTIRPLSSSSTSHFIPIAPKDPNRPIKPKEERIEALYLRTVHVPQKIPLPTVSQTKKENSENSVNQLTLNSDAEKNIFVKPEVIQNTENVNHPVSVSVNSTEANKFISMESITLYSTENSIKTSVNNANMPIISVEENISLSGTGLSPYLKLSCSKTNQNHNLSDIDLIPIENLKNFSQTVMTNENKEKNLGMSKKNDCDIISKRTPRSLLKSRSKTHRLSLSTPRRRSTHIRALDFSTPPKTMHSSTKLKENEASSCFPKSSKNRKPICRTSLFKSPSFSNAPIATERSKSPPRTSSLNGMSITSTSPAPKLMGDWEKYNGVGVIIGETSPIKSNTLPSPKSKSTLQKPKELKKSWDADLRKCLQISNDEYVPRRGPTTKSNSKEQKGDRNFKRNPRGLKTKGKKKSDEVQLPDTKKSFNQTQENELDTNVTGNAQRNNKPETAVAINGPIISDNNSLLNEAKKGTNSSDVFQKVDTQKSLPRSTNPSGTAVGSSNTINKSNNVAPEKKVTKKYVQLKTLKTNLKKPDTEKNMDRITPVADVIQTVEFNKTSMEFPRQILPDMIDLETPRKFENPYGVPPTPRLLSPNSSIITPFPKALNEDSSRIRSFINTPEFPTTPCIALTPNHDEETTRSAMKKEEYNGCSPYYRPSSEQKRDNEKSVKQKYNNCAMQHIIAPTTEIKSKESSDNSYDKIAVSTKLEITQFEVIKENLPKEEAVKELKISCNTKDSSNASSSRCIDQNAMSEDAKKYSVALDEKDCYPNNNEDSSDSDTSSSSDSSSTSSSSSSSSASSVSPTTNSITLSCDKRHKRAINRTHVDTSNEVSTNVQADPTKDKVTTNLQTTVINKTDITTKQIFSDVKTESSPTKLLLLNKDEEQLKLTLKETPAKDETLLEEANISETPSSSKTGIEHLTNLSSKISAFINAEEEEKLKVTSPKEEMNITNKVKEKPTIMNDEKVDLSNTILQPSRLIENKNEILTTDTKFVTQLEKKRQRIIAKLKDTSKSNIPFIKTRKNQTALSLRNRTGYTKKSNQLHDKMKSRATIVRRQNLKNDKQSHGEQNSIKTITNTYSTKELKIMKKEDDRQCSTGKSDKDKNSVKNVDGLKQANMNTNDKINSEKHNSMYNKVENVTETNVKESHRNSYDKETIIQENANMETIKQQMQSSNDDRGCTLKDYADKTKGILKSKVDQIKRDLFSDEENDQKSKVPQKSQNTDLVHLELQQKNGSVSEHIERTIPVENLEIKSTKENLSCVLETLQLVPASKNDQNEDAESNQTKLDNEEAELITATLSSVEYHFVYDDNAPIKKRRRRFSSSELQCEIRVQDDDCRSVMKILVASDYQEIFNMNPKSKKKPAIRKSPSKSEKDHRVDDPKSGNNTFTFKEGYTKPLATSSPLDKPQLSKLKKTNVSDGQLAKVQKRKSSESKEDTKQVDKKRTYDPQTLLKSMDLDEFLTSVHGPTGV